MQSQIVRFSALAACTAIFLTAAAHQVRRLGHDRWKLENNGWNDLTQNWAFKHDFLHACRHRPQTCSPDGKRQPVPNRGLHAVTLILLLAFTLWRPSLNATPSCSGAIG